MVTTLANSASKLVADFFKNSDPVKARRALSIWALCSKVFTGQTEKNILENFKKTLSTADRLSFTNLLKKRIVSDKEFAADLFLACNKSYESVNRFYYKGRLDFLKEPADYRQLFPANYIDHFRKRLAAAKKAAPKKATPAKKAAPKKAMPAKKAALKKADWDADQHVVKNAGKTITCYSAAQMDKEFMVKEIVEVEVILSRSAIKAGSGKLIDGSKDKIGKEIPLTLEIRAVKNMKIVGKTSQTVPVPGTTEAKYQFKTKATHLGKCSVAVSLWQGQVPICTLHLEGNSVQKKSHKGKIVAEEVSVPVIPFDRAVHQLRIFPQESGSKRFYLYAFDSPLLQIHETFRSDPTDNDIEKYISELYKQIEKLWKTSGENQHLFTRALRNFGADLYKQLFPLELRKLLYDNKNKLTSIQLFTDDPFIPWELLLVKHPDNSIGIKPSDKCLGEFGLVRWLESSSPERKLFARKDMSRYIVPEYEGEDELPASLLEKAYLEEKLGAVAVLPDPNVIDKLIKKKNSLDVLHFCCHGEADQDNITYANLFIGEKTVKGKIVERYLTQSSIEQCGTMSKGTRPLVVINACQTGRSGNKLVGVGGFARAFLKAGAGAFVGSLWSIEDIPAVTFITNFYDQLLAGKNLSDATVAAREAAKRNGDATWISYVVYGDPFATLTR